MALTKIDDRGLKTPIDLQDNENIRLGTGNDLKLYHDGSESVILSETGGLQIKDTGGYMRIRSDELKIQSEANETYIEADANGAVQLFYNNSKKLETTSGGATLSGALTVNSGDVDIATDGHKIKIGAGDDLQLYHESNESYIVNSTNQLYVRSNQGIYIQPATNENGVVALPNGAVELYYDNSKKFETTSSGVSVTGDGEVKALSNTADNTDKKALFTTGHRDTSEENVSGVIVTGADGDNIVDIGGGHGSYNSATKVRFYTGANATTTTGTERMRINPTGTVIIGATSYAGGGSTPFLYVSGTGGRQVKIHNTGNATSSIQLTNSGTGQGDDNGFQIAALGSSLDGWINNVEDANIRFGTNNAEKLRIQAAGGISFNGDTAAANALDDYEEGTWSPGVDKNASSMSCSYAYSTGTYTKIGRLVMVWFDFQVNSTSNSGSGSPYITELPFTALYGSGGGNNYGGYGAPTFRDASLTHSDLRVYGNSSYVQNKQIYLQHYNSSGNATQSSLNGSGRITGQAFYFTA